jgi:hypothetical protein
VLPTEWWGEALFRLRFSASFTNPDAGLIMLQAHICVNESYLAPMPMSMQAAPLSQLFSLKSKVPGHMSQGGPTKDITPTIKAVFMG